MASILLNSPVRASRANRFPHSWRERRGKVGMYMAAGVVPQELMAVQERKLMACVGSPRAENNWWYSTATRVIFT
jgi:hypothetical protein